MPRSAVAFGEPIAAAAVARLQVDQLAGIRRRPRAGRAAVPSAPSASRSEILSAVPPWRRALDAARGHAVAWSGRLPAPRSAVAFGEPIAAAPVERLQVDQLAGIRRRPCAGRSAVPSAPSASRSEILSAVPSWRRALDAARGHAVAWSGRRLAPRRTWFG